MFFQQCWSSVLSLCYRPSVHFFIILCLCHKERYTTHILYYYVFRFQGIQVLIINYIVLKYNYILQRRQTYHADRQMYFVWRLRNYHSCTTATTACNARPSSVLPGVRITCVSATRVSIKCSTRLPKRPTVAYVRVSLIYICPRPRVLNFLNLCHYIIIFLWITVGYF